VALEVVLPSALLVGKLGERPEPVADRVPCGLVAGGDEQQDERAESSGGSASPSTGVDEGRRDVLLRMLEPIAPEPQP